MTAVLIMLGSNIQPEHYLPAAMSLLETHPQLQLCRRSPTYVTAPVGGDPGQAPFHNAAVLVQTELTPTDLMAALRAMEAQLDRVRTVDKYGPRTIDLDIAYYGRQTGLCNGRPIPDPDAIRRPHIALPVASIAPDWLHPELQIPLREVAARLTYTEKEIRIL